MLVAKNKNVHFGSVANQTLSECKFREKKNCFVLFVVVESQNKQRYRGLVIHSGHAEYLNTLLNCLLLLQNIQSLICLIATIGDL